jgi:hypothetical protein
MKVIRCRVNTNQYSIENADYKCLFNEEVVFTGSEQECKSYIDERVKNYYSNNVFAIRD